MDIKIIGDVITKFEPLSLIINKKEGVIWISEELRKEFDPVDQKKLKTTGIFKKDIQDIKTNNIITIKDRKYNFSSIDIEKGNFKIVIFNLIGNFDDSKVKLSFYETIIDDLNDGVLLTDKEGKIILYNRSMEELEGRKKDEMVGKKIWDAYGYNDETQSEHMNVYKTKTPIIDRYSAHAYNNGKPIYKSYSTLPIEKDGEIIGVYSISKNESKLRTLLSEIVELKRLSNYVGTDEQKTYNNGTRYNFLDIVGSNKNTKKVIEEAKAMAWLDNNILVVGDTGTGKEVFVQSIHNYGKRKLEPFIGINCSAIPENLLESILFGSVKGAYTGALDSKGLFEEAGSGTLLLDELNSMPMNMQSKLLRVVQENSIRRVGGTDNIPVNCRVISAINEDPYYLIKSGKLRQDLFYRIAGYILYLPKLVDRGMDIYELSDYFISKYNILMNRKILTISSKVKNLMVNYSWPGNIRQLEHFIQNVMARSREDDTILKINNIPDYLMKVMIKENKKSFSFDEKDKSFQVELDEIEIKLIKEGLEKNNMNITKTALFLGITRQSLIYRMRKFGIERKL